METERIEVLPLPASRCAETSGVIHAVIGDLEYYSEDARRAEQSKYSADKLSALIGSDPQSVLIAIDRGVVAGFCITTYDDGLIWLAWFGVSKICRKHGIGSQLLAAAIATVESRGGHKIWCDTRTVNEESASALNRAGFRKICKIERHWYGHDFFLWERFI